MTAPPLTHHEIVRLVEPFARRGRHVDLGASDRPSRRIVFKARDVAADPPGAPEWHERLELDCRSQGHFVLTRTLTGPRGAKALLEASGPDPAELLLHIDAIPPARHFSAGAGYLVARSYDIGLPGRLPAGGAGETVPLVLTHAALQVDGLTLGLANRLPRLRNVAADLTLVPSPGLTPDLPEDLLAVLGWDWARLIRGQDGWSSKLRLSGAVLRRSRTVEAALERVGAHLARVLAEPPEKFHDRHRLARWGVVARRAIQSLTVVLMVAGASLLPQLTDASSAGLWMALHYVPIGLLAVSFSLQELAQLEIPPWPRRSRARQWNERLTTEADPAR